MLRIIELLGGASLWEDDIEGGVSRAAAQATVEDKTRRFIERWEQRVEAGPDSVEYVDVLDTPERGEVRAEKEIQLGPPVALAVHGVSGAPVQVDMSEVVQAMNDNTSRLVVKLDDILVAIDGLGGSSRNYHIIRNVPIGFSMGGKNMQTWSNLIENLCGTDINYDHSYVGHAKTNISHYDMWKYSISGHPNRFELFTSTVLQAGDIILVGGPNEAGRIRAVWRPTDTVAGYRVRMQTNRLETIVIEGSAAGFYMVE